MKSNSFMATVLLAAFVLCGASAHAQDSKSQGKGEGVGAGVGQGVGKGEGEGEEQQGAEASVATTNTVTVSLTTAAGRISVHGWERNEVRAQTRSADTKIEMRKDVGTDAANPAMRLEILVSNKSEEGETEDGSCNTDTDVMVEVPRGATVYLRTQDGDVEVDDVAEAHIETTDGRIEARRISKAIDAASVGGNVALEDAKGRARLSSVNGVIEASGLRPLDGSDFLKVKTVSGDILLEEVGQARVEASTISGELRLMGMLARGGLYEFTTTNSDISMLLPVESSFKLNAKVSEGGEIITEFPLKYKGAASPISLLQAGRLLGTYGSGDATINLVSFSGTLRLKKQ
jgi:DUF4097 and DUF4098 domain-containing protein YvlB